MALSVSKSTLLSHSHMQKKAVLGENGESTITARNHKQNSFSSSYINE